ncbi:MAG TPA: DUF5996 family protein [Planctomycetota bacterium]|nr:DUF5996 family protein [Planctomycetota bacterium]
MNGPPDPAEARSGTWPALPLQAWKDTCATLHLWTQIVGKVRLVQSAPVNHWWHVPLYVTPRGLATSIIPHGTRCFEITFDFIDHVLLIQTGEGRTRVLKLEPRSVADFHRELMATLRELGLGVTIHATPDELEDPVPFAEDVAHASYDAEYAHRHWRVLVQVDRVFKRFRSDFLGKCSPVHFFWGSFDLAVTRFSGRRAPAMPDADAITREGYSHEVISHGFWPGSGGVQEPAFYSYTSPAPEGYAGAKVRPASSFYNPGTTQFILRYDDVRRAPDSDAMLMDFLQSTYAAGADLAKWDRAALERPAAK